MKYDAVFLIGIGGIGMSALAKYFIHQDIPTYGYDKTESSITQDLSAQSATITFEEELNFFETFLSKYTNPLLIKTPAVRQNHPYFLLAEKQGFSFKKRSEVLGEISKEITCLSVAGTHGKTTISSMLAMILKESGRPMIAFLGGITKDFNSNFYIKEGENPVMVVEADEFDRSFHRLDSDFGVISNIDPDHLDIYGDFEGIKTGFNQFANKVKTSIVVHEEFSKWITREAKIYGKKGDYSYDLKDGKVVFSSKKSSFELNLKIGGIHNIENALAAFSIASELEIDPLISKKGLETFKGIGRRFDVQISKDDLIYIDDYAHHPFEIKALLNSIKVMYPNKKIAAAFQPHLFSRTQDFVDDFRKELSEIDELVLLDIYPAREEPISGVDSDWLKEGVNTIVHRSTVSDYVDVLSKIEADIFLTIGAGDIGTKVNDLKTALLK